MKSFVLAAGFGSRFRPHTDIVPKPALPFLNVPLATFGLEILRTINALDLVVNTFHLPQKIHQLFLNDLKESYTTLQFSDEKDFIRGSGGGLKYAEKYFLNAGENIILMNADEVFYPHNNDFLKNALSFHIENKNLSTLITMDHPEVGSKFGGVWVDSKNQIIDFGKMKPESAVRGLHFLGIQILSKKIFSFLEDNRDFNILYDGLKIAMTQGYQCFAYNVKSPRSSSRISPFSGI